ncbi:MAG TPA: hypothetical protein VHW09_08870 [Bryobacteraceae bacterium]|jgi:hypothetical protein|nr:hypothetical protein [Bryobacteraceae bacterium]
MNAPYQVTSDFTVFRTRDKAPKHLKIGIQVTADDPLNDPVNLEIERERFQTERNVFLAHTEKCD